MEEIINTDLYKDIHSEAYNNKNHVYDYRVEERGRSFQSFMDQYCKFTPQERVDYFISHAKEGSFGRFDLFQSVEPSEAGAGDKYQETDEVIRVNVIKNIAIYEALRVEHNTRELFHKYVNPQKGSGIGMGSKKIGKSGGRLKKGEVAPKDMPPGGGSD